MDAERRPDHDQVGRWLQCGEESTRQRPGRFPSLEDKVPEPSAGVG